MWVKGKVNWQGKEILDDNTNWHDVCEYSYCLYVDGKMVYKLVLTSDDKFEVIEVKEK